MKQTLAFYEHSTIGFPGVVLKFSVQKEFELKDGCYTVKGIIGRKWPWAAQFDSCFEYELQKQLERFDSWVRLNYANDITVQG
jgi:hypothetical protein